VRVAALFGVPLKGDQAGYHSIRVNDQYRITLNEIVLGKRGITHDTALRLAKLLKTSPQLWMRLHRLGFARSA